MSISYDPLWRTLAERNLSKKDLRHKAGIATATMAKLGRNESLTLTMIDKICCSLHCRIEDVVEIKDDVSPVVPISELIKEGAVLKIDIKGRHTYGIVNQIFSPGRGIPTFYIFLPITNYTDTTDLSRPHVILSPFEGNRGRYTPCVYYNDGFPITEDAIVDIGLYLPDEEMKKIREAIYQLEEETLKESRESEGYMT